MSSVENLNSKIEIEFLKLELQAVETDVEKKSTRNSSLTCAASSSPVLLSFSPWFFFIGSAFSKEVFGSGTSASSSHF